MPYLDSNFLIKQYTQGKPTEYSIKFWTMACSKTNYIHNLGVYINKFVEDESQEEISLIGHGIVMRLYKHVYYLNHTCLFDNFFMSPWLMESLLQQGMYAVRTVRQGREGFATSLNCSKNDRPWKTL